MGRSTFFMTVRKCSQCGSTKVSLNTVTTRVNFITKYLCNNIHGRSPPSMVESKFPSGNLSFFSRLSDFSFWCIEHDFVSDSKSLNSRNSFQTSFWITIELRLMCSQLTSVSLFLGTGRSSDSVESGYCEKGAITLLTKTSSNIEYQF